MLQVSKKTHRKTPRKLLWVLLGAAVLTAAALVCFTGGKEAEIPHREITGGTILDYQKTDIQSIQVRIRGNEGWFAERDGEGRLRMDGGEGWELDEILGERIEDALAHLVYEDILTEDPGDYQDRLSEFGLEDPEIIANVTFSDGREAVIRIGNDSGLEDEDFRFMTVDGDSRLYAVAGSLVKDLYVEKDLLHPVIQPEIQLGRIDRITVMNGDGTMKAQWELQGRITDRDADSGWQVTYPFLYPASQDRMVTLKKNIGNLRMGIFVADAENADLEQYGLKEPVFILEIHMAQGSTGTVTEHGAYDVRNHPEETIRYLIGNARNEMTDYCLFGSSIYTVNHFTVSAVIGSGPTETLARYPVTLTAENLRSLEIIREGEETVLYELIPGEADEEGAEEGAEKRTKCLKNGKEISAEAFLAAYERWRVVNVSGTLPQGWKKKETKTKFVFSSGQGKTHTVELSDFDALHDAVTVDGQTLFYLVRNSFDEMP